MAIPDISGIFSSFSNLPGGDYLKIGISIVGVAFIGFVAIEVASSVRSRRGEEGTWGEGSLEREEGYGWLRRRLNELEGYEDQLRKREEDLEAAERGEEAKSGDESSRGYAEAIEEGAEAAEHGQAAEKATIAIVWRGMAVIAAAKKIVKSAIAYGYQRGSNVPKEEELGNVIEGILEDISRFSNDDEINNKIRYYITRFHMKLVEVLKRDVEIERQNERLIENLVTELEDTVGNMIDAIEETRFELNKLRSEERKERSHFKRELKDFIKALKAKKQELRRLDSSRNADPQVIAALRQEISLREEQIENVKTIRRQLKVTYSFIKKAVRQMKKLLRYVLANELDMRRYDSELVKRRKQIKERFEVLRSVLYSIESIPKDLQTENPHEFALLLSGRMKSYFERYIAVIEEDLSFDDIVKDVTIKNLVISQQMEAYQQLATSLTRSEEAIKFGVKASTQLIGSAVGGASRINVEQIVKVLEDSTQILKFEEKVEAFMQNIAQTIQSKSRALSSTIQRIIDEGKNLLARVKEQEERNSSHLGNLMATMYERKLQIHNKYIKPAVQFGQQLEQTNPKVASAYKQALNLESLAPAA